MLFSDHGSDEGLRQKANVSWCCANHCWFACLWWRGYCPVSFWSLILRHLETATVKSLINSLRSLSKDVYERRTSTGSEAFSLYICLDSNKFVFLSFFSLIKRMYPRVSTKPLPNDAKSPLPVVVRRSKMLLLKLPIYLWKAHVVCITDAKEDWRTWVTGETRANGAQCLSSLKADKTLLVKAARGGCCNKELGGWRSAPVSSGCKNKNKSN